MLLNKEGKTRQFRHDIMAELMQIKSYVERKEYQALDKQDKRNHGFGIKNIKKTVKKYNGNFLCKVENNMFYSEIQIKNDRLSKK